MEGRANTAEQLDGDVDGADRWHFLRRERNKLEGDFFLGSQYELQHELQLGNMMNSVNVPCPHFHINLR